MIWVIFEKQKGQINDMENSCGNIERRCKGTDQVGF